MSMRRASCCVAVAAAAASAAAAAVAVLAPFLITRRMRDNSKQIASISMLLAARRVRRDSCDGAQRQHATAAATAADTSNGSNSLAHPTNCK